MWINYYWITQNSGPDFISVVEKSASGSREIKILENDIKFPRSRQFLLARLLFLTVHVTRGRKDL